MNFHYKREMKHNYLVIEPESGQEQCYECRMMMNNVIEGLLKLRVKQVDGHPYFYYEITSKQPISRILETRGIEQEGLAQLILGISSTLDRMEAYLLKDSQILLEPDFLYVNPDTYEVSMCLVPGRDENFPDAMRKLLQGLLGKVNHQDKESVVLAYGLFQECQKENYGMEDLLNFLQKNYRQQDDGNAEGRCAEEAGEYGETNPDNMYTSASRTSAHMLREDGVAYGASAELGKQKQKSGGVLAWIKQFFGHRKEETLAEEEQEQWRMAFDQLPQEHPEAPAEIRHESPYGTYTAQAITAEPQPEPMTTLLSERDPEPPDRRLVSLDPSVEDIAIGYYPFLIGKQEHLVDYVLNRETVSRLHLRIDRQGDAYLMTDLNSTNGTMIQGIPLETNGSRVVHPGEEVRIAGFSFLFQ